MFSIEKNTAASDEEFALLRRVWAEKKIAQLRREGAESKAIDMVGRRYGIVTEGNSLIVLETVEDYVRYQITPPKELLQEYNKLSSEINSEKMEEQKEALERVISQSKEQTSWWQTSYPIKKKNTKKNKKVLKKKSKTNVYSKNKDEKKWLRGLVEDDLRGY